MDMEQVVYQLVMYLNCIFEVYLLYNFLEVLFPVYEERKWVMWLESLGCITAIFLVNCLKNPLFNLICVPLIYILFIWLNFRMDFKVSLPYSVVFYLILAVTEAAFLYIYPLLGIDINKLNLRRVIFLMLQDILRFIIVQLIKQRYYIPPNRRCKYTKSLYIFPVAAMLLLNGVITLDRHPLGDILISLGSIMMIVSNIIIFSVIEKLLQAQNAIKDNELLVLKTSLERQRFMKMEEINEEYAGCVHDMRHAFKTIGRLAETENIEEIRRLSLEATELLKEKSLLDRKKYIEDTIVDAIISEREKIAKAKGISFCMDISNGIDISFISDLDKIRIFGNLLDNALEAAASCDDGYITLELRQGNGSIVILHIVNNFKRENNKRGNVYLTTKDDKVRHGFGIKNVKELAEKYNGILKITEQENIFSITLTLSNARKVENGDNFGKTF